MARKQYFRNSGQKGGFRNKAAKAQQGQVVEGAEGTEGVQTSGAQQSNSGFTGEFAEEFEQIEKEERAKRVQEQQLNPEDLEVEEEVIDLSEQVSQAETFWEKNQKLIIGALAGILFLIGAVLIYNLLVTLPKQKEATNAMFRAEQAFASDNFAGALESENSDQLGFLDIINEYGGTPSGNLAKYYAGVSYLNLGKFEDAIKYLNDYSANDDNTSITKYSAIGDANAELKKFDEAISSYKKAISAGSNDALTPFVMEKLSFLYKSQGQNEAAQKLQNEIATKYPKSSIGRKYNALK